MTIKTILAAYDFSDPATRALKEAVRLSKELGAALHLVHVHVDIYTTPDVPAAGVPWPSADQVERYIQFLHQELARAAHAAAPETADKIQIHVVRGDPVRSLLACADRVGADLICVGSTGKGAVQRLLLGSVTQSVLRTSKTPVLTVH